MAKKPKKRPAPDWGAALDAAADAARRKRGRSPEVLRAKALAARFAARKR